MIDTGSVKVDCPACGEPLTIPTQVTSTGLRTIELKLDRAYVDRHLASHPR